MYTVSLRDQRVYGIVVIIYHFLLFYKSIHAKICALLGKSLKVEEASLFTYIGPTSEIFKKVPCTVHILSD